MKKTLLSLLLPCLISQATFALNCDQTYMENPFEFVMLGTPDQVVRCIYRHPSGKMIDYIYSRDGYFKPEKKSSWYQYMPGIIACKSQNSRDCGFIKDA